MIDHNVIHLLHVCVCSVAQSLRLHGFLCPWGFSRLEHWRGLPGPPPGDLPNPETELRSPALQVNSLPSETPGKPKIVA